MDFHKSIKKSLIKSLEKISENEIIHLNNAFRLLGKWRSVLITNTYIQNEGLIVNEGPFKGMNFLNQSSEGCHVAKLLGTYEQPLHEYFEKIIDSNYELIINIGSAEGYYSVGLAMRSPKSTVLSFDTDLKAQENCKDLAIKNNLDKSIKIMSEFHPNILRKYKNISTFVLCDVEGDELKLMDLENYHEFKNIDLLIESHECLKPGITQKLIERFSPSHDIEKICDNGNRVLKNPPDWFSSLAHLDQLISLWEWRSGPTPWLFMKAKRK